MTNEDIEFADQPSDPELSPEKVEFIKSQRGKDLLAFNGFLYELESKSTTKKCSFWRWINRKKIGCQVRAKLKDGDDQPDILHEHVGHYSNYEVVAAKRAKVNSLLL